MKPELSKDAAKRDLMWASIENPLDLAIIAILFFQAGEPNVSQTAVRLGISRPMVYSALKRTQSLLLKYKLIDTSK